MAAMIYEGWSISNEKVTKEFSFNKIYSPLESLFPSRSVCRSRSACDLIWLLCNAFLVVCLTQCTEIEKNEKRAINNYLHEINISIHLDMKELLETQATVYRWTAALYTGLLKLQLKLCIIDKWSLLSVVNLRPLTPCWWALCLNVTGVLPLSGPCLFFHISLAASNRECSNCRWLFVMRWIWQWMRSWREMTECFWLVKKSLSMTVLTRCFNRYISQHFVSHFTTGYWLWLYYHCYYCH